MMVKPKLRLKRPTRLEALAVPGFPLISGPCDLGAVVVRVLRRAGLGFIPQRGDVLVLAHKVVSKAEGRVVPLKAVVPGPRAQALARAVGKDPRLVELVLREARRVVRAVPGVLIAEHRLGVICANAGVDRSNAGPGRVVLLPEDPDRSARRVRRAVIQAWGAQVGVLIADTHGRPWREGAVGLCLGVAGLAPLLDLRGEPDLFGVELASSVEGVADELCAAATLVMGQGGEGVPLVLIRGFCGRPDPQASSDQLLRPPERDLFR